MENPLKDLTPLQRKIRVALHKVEESIMGMRSCTGTIEQRYRAYVLRHNYHDLTFAEYVATKNAGIDKRKYHGTGCKEGKVNSIFFD